MSLKQDITERDGFFNGEDKNIQFDVVDADGNPEDMTGWGLTFVMRRTAASPGETVVRVTPTEIVITDGDDDNSRAIVTIPAAQTVNIRPGQYEYSLNRTDASAKQVLAYGEIILQLPAAR